MNVLSWLARKFDSLIGAVFGGVGGALASQFDAFVLQYLQRLGGHIDEAERNFKMASDGEQYRDMAVDVREILMAAARARVDELTLALRAIADADLWHRPFAFFAHMDREIAARTLDSFRPALPVDLAGLVYAASGIVLGLVLYELLKAPFSLRLRRRDARRSDQRF